MTPGVSFIIPSYNSWMTIRKTLDSIRRQSAREHIREVIVVDSSDDETTRLLLTEYAGCLEARVIFSDHRLTPAAGRNLGVREASGDLLCFIDSDMCLEKNWLQEVLEAYQSQCRAGGGSIGLVPSQKNDLLVLAQYYLQCNEYLPTESACRKLFVPSCNMFCSRELFEKAGGFPEIRASEDTLFFLRLKGIAPVFFIPSARGDHIFRRNWKSFVRTQYLLGKYVSIYRRNYYRSWMYRGLVPIILSPAFLAFKFLRICRRIIGAGGGHVRDFLRSFPIFCLGFLAWSGGFIYGFMEKKHAYSWSELSQRDVSGSLAPRA